MTLSEVHLTPILGGIRSTIVCCCFFFPVYNSKAGIASPDNKEQLIIALEPEAGAIFCKERKLKDFVGQTGSARVSDTLVSPGKSYVMMDIGGTK